MSLYCQSRRKLGYFMLEKIIKSTLEEKPHSQQIFLPCTIYTHSRSILQYFSKKMKKTRWKNLKSRLYVSSPKILFFSTFFAIPDPETPPHKLHLSGGSLEVVDLERVIERDSVIDNNSDNCYRAF